MKNVAAARWATGALVIAAVLAVVVVAANPPSNAIAQDAKETGDAAALVAALEAARWATGWAAQAESEAQAAEREAAKLDVDAKAIASATEMVAAGDTRLFGEYAVAWARNWAAKTRKEADLPNEWEQRWEDQRERSAAERELATSLGEIIERARAADGWEGGLRSDVLPRLGLEHVAPSSPLAELAESLALTMRRHGRSRDAEAARKASEDQTAREATKWEATAKWAEAEDRDVTTKREAERATQWVAEAEKEAAEATKALSEARDAEQRKSAKVKEAEKWVSEAAEARKNVRGGWEQQEADRKVQVARQALDIAEVEAEAAKKGLAEAQERGTKAEAAAVGAKPRAAEAKERAAAKTDTAKLRAEARARWQAESDAIATARTAAADRAAKWKAEATAMAQAAARWEAEAKSIARAKGTG